MSSPTTADVPKSRLVMRSSTKIALAFVVVAIGVYFGRDLWSAYQVDHLSFGEIKPGIVNLVAINPGSGHQIIVANQTAQLVEGSGGAFAAEANRETSPDEGSAVTGRKRVPIKELLLALQGDSIGLSRFVSIINDLGEAKLPTERIVWTAEDIRKALDGDQATKNRLEADLNVHIDGSPLDHLSKSALLNGIVIDSPVQVQVSVGGEIRMLTARIQEPFKVRLMRSVEQQIKDKFDVTDHMLAGYYREAVQKLGIDPRTKEDVRQSLMDQIRPERLAEYAAAPQRTLRDAKVIVNDALIQGARYERVETPNGKSLYNLKIQLSDEGRLRLWKHSRDHPGFQLLLIVDGIAIAAPRINGELAMNEVTITQLPDEGLVQEAVERMNNKNNARVGN